MSYKFTSKDRNYDEWSICDSDTFKVVESPVINPIQDRLFNQDIFNIEDGRAIVKNSVVRKSKHISAVLMISNGKTFGIMNRKKLYKCVPDDNRLPTFLVPYEIKNTGFSKVIKNKYVIIQFYEWKDKHPIAKIQNTIGDVDKLENFYEYLLYCKSLYASIHNFTQDTTRALKKKSTDEFIKMITKKYSLEDRTNLDTYTIDPQNSKDFDDAFSVKSIDGKDNEFVMSIYISNVVLWMEELGLWNSFSTRISTIYLPDKKRPMLPTILSECLCSLIEKEKRFAFTMDIHIVDNIIKSVTFKNTLIEVNRNMRYDTPEIQENKTYNRIFDIVTNLNKNKQFHYVDNIKTSHDIIAYLMIIMNYYSSKELLKFKTGIFRNAEKNVVYNAPSSLPNDIQKFLTYWKSSGGVYDKLTDNNISVIRSHELLNLDSYVHITSPIRRLVDLLNIIKLQNSLNLIKSKESSEEFYRNWTNKESLEYINKTTRAIKKIQCSCNLLDLCVKKPEILDTVYTGYLFDKIERTDHLFQYVVYIHELKLISKFVSRHEFAEYEKRNFKLFLFLDEERYKRKIRINIFEE